jgi:hypothetical protein
MAAESAKRENKKARTAAIANAVAGVPYAAERRLKLKARGGRALSAAALAPWPVSACTACASAAAFPRLAA